MMLPNDHRSRVVVTGMGAVSPLGLDVASLWDSIQAGRSGVATITRWDPAGLDTTFGGEVKNFNPDESVGKKQARRMDRYSQFGVAAGLEAWRQAGLTMNDGLAARTAVLVATAIGGMETFEQGVLTLHERGPQRLSPFLMPMLLPNMASGNVAIAVGAKGPNYAPTSACASAAHAIGEAAEVIRRGDADVALAGGAEAPVTRFSVASFGAMGALSTRNDAPSRASRPFDADRDGFVLAEGAAMLVLESERHARQRGATIYGVISGYGATDDANHLVQPAPGGEGAARAMTRALEHARLAPGDIDYINAHGTSTPLSEKLETAAVKRVFNDHADIPPMSSTKSMTGHLLGAAGALETIISLQAIGASCIPPTINYETPDPECDLDCVPNTARAASLRHVMSNSLGFGGHNVALIVSAYASGD